MVQHLDAENLASLGEATGDFDILLAGGRVAGRVVVGEDDIGGVHQDLGLEHLGRCPC